jgi:oligopeptide transport system permease protein
MAVQQATKNDLTNAEGMRKARSPLADAYRDLLRNRAAVAGGIFIIIIVSVGILSGFLAPFHFADVHFDQTYAKPGGEFPMGADQMGRDILSRTLYGTRISLTVGVVGATVSLIIGLVYGLTSGFFGGRVDNLMMRLVDFMYGLPNIILVILMQVYFKAVSRREAAGLAGALVELDHSMGGMFFIFIALGVFNWIGMARIARGQVLSVKEKEYVEAARAVGAGNQRIILRHILPNILGPCIVAETLAIPGYIFFEAFLSFIGLGVNPPTPSWGAMINQGYQGLRSNPHLVIAPSIALTLTVLSFNFFGDGLRDAFDPRVRGVAGPRVGRRERLARGFTRRRLAVGFAALLLVVVGVFAVFRGRGVEDDIQVTPLPEVSTYITEFGHEISTAETTYDSPKAGFVSSLSPIPSVFFAPVGQSMLGIIGREAEVEVLGETTNEDGTLFYLIKGFGSEGWMPAADITIEEP